MPHRTSIAIRLSSLLRHCAPLSAVRPGQQTHAQSLTLGLLDPTLQTDLILMYSRCSHIDVARQIFDRMPHRTMHSWNILLSSYVQHSLYHHALSLLPPFLHSNLRPDYFTLPSLFKACAGANDFSSGISLHNLAIRLGFEGQIVVRSSILDMYAKSGCMADAHKLFETMHEKDCVVWNSMITGFARAGHSAEAVGLFRKSQWEGGEMDTMAVPSVLSACGRGGELRRGREVHGRLIRCLVVNYDIAVNNSLIEMYAKCGCLDDSCKVFLIMGGRNLITWSTLISCYGVHGKGNESLSLYNEMIAQGFKPNSITFTSILSSCSHSGLIVEGRSLFESITKVHGIEPSVEHYACMVDLFGRAGSIKEALRLIEDMPMEPTASVWGALLSASALHRNVEIGEVAAFKLFELEGGNCSNYVALCGIYEMVGMWDGVVKMRARMRELGVVKMPGCSWIDVKGRVYAFYQGDVCCPFSQRICEVLDGLWKTMAMGSSRESAHKLDGFGGP